MRQPDPLYNPPPSNRRSGAPLSSNPLYPQNVNKYANFNSLLYAPNGRIPQFSPPDAALHPLPDSPRLSSSDVPPSPSPSMGFQLFISLLLKLCNTFIDKVRSSSPKLWHSWYNPICSANCASSVMSHMPSNVNQNTANPPSTLNILQWNCRSFYNKLDSLRNTIANFDILALSETWLNPSHQVYLQDFHIYRKDTFVHNFGGLLLTIKTLSSLNMLRIVYKSLTGLIV